MRNGIQQERIRLTTSTLFAGYRNGIHSDVIRMINNHIIIP